MEINIYQLKNGEITLSGTLVTEEPNTLQNHKSATFTIEEKQLTLYFELNKNGDGIQQYSWVYYKDKEGNLYKLVDYNLGAGPEWEKHFFWDSFNGTNFTLVGSDSLWVDAPPPIGMILGSYQSHAGNVGANPLQSQYSTYPHKGKHLSDFRNGAELTFNLGEGSHSSFQVIYGGQNGLGAREYEENKEKFDELFPNYDYSTGREGPGGSNDHIVNINFKGPAEGEGKTEFRFSGIFGGRGAQHGWLASASNNKVIFAPDESTPDARLKVIVTPDWMKGYIFGGEAWNASENLVYLENVDMKNLDTQLGIVGGRGNEAFHLLDSEDLRKDGYTMLPEEASGMAVHNVVIIKDSTIGNLTQEDEDQNYENKSANIYGGYSLGTANNNIVSVENSTINGHIYGGFELLNKLEETLEDTWGAGARALHRNLVSLHNVNMVGTSAVHGSATGNTKLTELEKDHKVANEDLLETISGRRGVAYLAGENHMSSAYVRYVHFGQYYDNNYLLDTENVRKIELEQSYYPHHRDEVSGESPAYLEGVIYTNNPLNYWDDQNKSFNEEKFKKEKIEIGQQVAGSYLFVRSGIHSSLDKRDETQSDFRKGQHNFWVGTYANLTNHVGGDGKSLNAQIKLFDTEGTGDKKTEVVNHEYQNGELSLLTHDDGMIVTQLTKSNGEKYSLLDSIQHDDGYHGRVLYLSVNNGYDENGDPVASVDINFSKIREFRRTQFNENFNAHGNTLVGVSIYGDSNVHFLSPDKKDTSDSATLESLSFDVPGFQITQGNQVVGTATYSFFKYLRFDGKIVDEDQSQEGSTEVQVLAKETLANDQDDVESTSGRIYTDPEQEGGDGLAYWLKSVDVHDGKMLTLYGLTDEYKPEEGLSEEEARGRYTLSASLHGKGGVLVPDSNTVIIGDSKSPYLRSAEDSLSDYYGPTIVGKKATLTQELNSALGNTYLLDVSNEGQYQLHQHKQTVGGLEESTNATIDLGEKGHLTVQKNSEKASAIAHINGSVEGEDNSILTVNNGYLVSTAPSSDFYGTFELKGATTGVFESNKSAHHAKVKIDKAATLFLNSAQPYEAKAETSSFLGGRANDAAPVPDHELNNTSSIERKIVYTDAMQNDGNLYLSKGMSVDNLNEYHIGSRDGEKAYQSQQGNIHYSIVMNSDDSPTDFVQAHGDAAGESFLYFSNWEGSKGARTKEGIPVYFIDGKSNLTLKLGAPAAAGAYYYDLISREDGTKWYLVNNETNLRSESGSYINNMQSIAWMEMRLHDRYGQSHWIDRFEGSEKEYAGWVRQVGVHSHNKVGGGKVKIHSLTGLTQAGLDLYRTHFNEEYDLGAHFGVFAGALYNKAKSKSLYTFKSQVDGYALGIYGTLFGGNGPDEKFYVDSWLSWGNYDNKIYGPLPEFKYKSRGWTASVEAGYHINLGETGEKPDDYLLWTLQPQAQVIWNGVRSKDAVDSTHTRYEAIGDKNGTLRLGARLNADHEGKWVMALEGNWIHRFKDIGVKMNGKKIFADGGRNVGEARVIYEGHLSQNLLGWSTLTYRKGSHGFHEESAQIGVRYMF